MDEMGERTVSLDSVDQRHRQDAGMTDTPPVSPYPDPSRPGWRARRTQAIAHRAAALRELAAAETNLATARRAIAADTPTRAAGKRAPQVSRSHVIVAALVGVPVIGLALCSALVAVGLSTEFWKTKLPTGSDNEHLLGLPFNLNLPGAVPVGAEGIVWALTLMAIVLVSFRRQYSAWTRPMWAVATTVAAINGLHNAQYDLIGGLGLGALSIGGPYVVHKYVLFVRALVAGKTYTEAYQDMVNRWRAVGRALRWMGRLVAAVLLALLDVVLHPILTGGAVLLWRMHGGTVDYVHAHRVVVAHHRDKRAGVGDGGEPRTYHKHLIDLIDPMGADPAAVPPKSPKPTRSPKPAAAEAPEPVQVTVPPPTGEPRHALPAQPEVVDFSAPTSRPDWLTDDMTAKAAIEGYLDRHGDTPGAWLTRWARNWFEINDDYGRNVRGKWLTRQPGDGDNRATAAGEE